MFHPYVRSESIRHAFIDFINPPSMDEFNGVTKTTRPDMRENVESGSISHKAW